MLSKKCSLKLFASLAMCLIVISGVNSCSKDDDEPDYRENFVGAYSGTENYTNNNTNYTNNVSITVTKSSVVSSRVIISGLFYTSMPDIVEIDVTKEGNFTGSLTKTLDGVSKTISITNGKFSGNTLSYSFSTQGFVTKTVSVTKI